MSHPGNLPPGRGCPCFRCFCSWGNQGIGPGQSMPATTATTTWDGEKWYSVRERRDEEDEWDHVPELSSVDSSAPLDYYDNLVAQNPVEQGDWLNVSHVPAIKRGWQRLPSKKKEEAGGRESEGGGEEEEEEDEEEDGQGKGKGKGKGKNGEALVKATTPSTTTPTNTVTTHAVAGDNSTPPTTTPTATAAAAVAASSINAAGHRIVGGNASQDAAAAQEKEKEKEKEGTTAVPDASTSTSAAAAAAAATNTATAAAATAAYLESLAVQQPPPPRRKRRLAVSLDYLLNHGRRAADAGAGIRDRDRGASGLWS